jgi:Na+-driven multidrug efflux pump
MIGKYIIGWLPLVVIGILNGVLRQEGYSKYVSELTAHQISTLTGIVLMGLFIWWLTGKWKIVSAGQAVAIGSIWLGMTVVFEFVFGHYVVGHPWEKLFFDYNILEGRVWVLVLIWTAVAPLVFYKIRSKS